MKFFISPRMISLAALLFSAAAFAQVSAVAPYTVSTFATSLPGVYTQPDSIAVLDGHVFIGFATERLPMVRMGKAAQLSNTIATAMSSPPIASRDTTMV